MKTLYRNIGRKDIGGEPLPPVFKAFASNNIHVRRGEVSMIAGIPGAGKSTLALAMALRMRVPTLYVCADTNAHTIAMRIYSMVSGVSQRDAERILAEEPMIARQRLADTSHIFWSFDSAPTLDDVQEEVQAFEELHGEPPHLIVIDNLVDMAGGVDQFGAMQELLLAFKVFARENNAALLVLHHTKESYTGNPCQPMSAVQGMVNQTPALILTVGQTAGDMFGVATVKNRYGRADISGGSPVWLRFAPEFMYIADVEDMR